MTPENAFLAYKRYTNYLVCWLIHTTSRISPPLAEVGGSTNVHAMNIKYGELMAKDLVSVSKFIVEHGVSVPPIIFRLLQEAIEARMAANAMFADGTYNDPDAESGKSKEQYKYLIEVLREAFVILGGKEWESTDQNSWNGGDNLTDGAVEEDLFSEKLDPLKAKQKTTESIPKSNLEAIPIESYRIVSGEGTATEYGVALSDLLINWIELRTFVQLHGTMWPIMELTVRLQVAGPKTALEYNPKKDIDQFIYAVDGEDTRNGFSQSADILSKMLTVDNLLNEDTQLHGSHIMLLQAAKLDYCNWLGKSPIKNGYKHMKGSRFQGTNPDGLWEYSPFLCGTALVEVMEEAYLTNMAIWDQIPEPTNLVHLHNMLVRKGYLEEPVILLNALDEVFSSAFYKDDLAPLNDFAAVLAERNEQIGKSRDSIPQAHRRTVVDPFGTMSMSDNTLFNKRCKPPLILYQEAGWNPDQIPDSELTIDYQLGKIRIAQTKTIVEQVTGERRLADTELQQDLDPTAISTQARDEEVIKKWVGKEHWDAVEIPGGQKRRGGLNPEPSDNKRADVEINDMWLLKMIAQDAADDIYGDKAISGINFTHVTAWIFHWYMAATKELKRTGNRVFRYAFMYDDDEGWCKNAKVIKIALQEQDEECFRIMADLLDEMRVDYDSFLSW
ncbi:uncharacterized protein F4807DRAFT_469708 [Annulohypoxylon truncatum]|uniref:uncharacterized protein n=1 Tax=Annulohypoxylon truncatum TaxID=327061 RepID=UPI0020074A9D|nr:uncharacterized protein F4807DRAFT_469708 [Annulohypoxylon truncatum]KAI1213970.1 hypothetical protein F4807DRAFT_469708 [Annulohypoxylon truncatum]